jgi:hypothetical protein
MSTAFKQVADNAISTTTTSLTSTGVTSITVASGNGALFPLPGNGFIVTLWNGTDPGADPNMEKVVCSARSTDVLTIGATAKTHTSPCNVGLLDVAQNTIDMQTAINNLEGMTSLTSVKTSAYTISSSDSIVVCDTSSGSFNVTLPDATTVQIGRNYKIKHIDTTANEVFIIPNGSQTIDGAPYITVSMANALLAVASDGSNWYLV